jgi:glyoxylase-like metal-dependent hydrolase (beta-lactamase superfamily II)
MDRLGNSTVFITENNGVVVIDAKNPGVGKLLLEQIGKITTQPITMLINSHTHADHTGGNVDFPVTTRFVAHLNTRTNMQKMDQFQGDNAKFLPTQVFLDRLSLFSGTDRVDLYLTNDFYGWVRAQKAAGKPVEQTAMEWQTPAKYVGYAPTNPMFLQRIVQVVYSEAQ